MLLAKKVVQKRNDYRWSRLMIFGFEEHHSTEQLCTGLALMIQTGREWNNTHPLFVLSADVLSAFDELCLDTVLEC